MGAGALFTFVFFIVFAIVLIPFWVALNFRLGFTTCAWVFTINSGLIPLTRNLPWIIAAAPWVILLMWVCHRAMRRSQNDQPGDVKGVYVQDGGGYRRT